MIARRLLRTAVIGLGVAVAALFIGGCVTDDYGYGGYNGDYYGNTYPYDYGYTYPYGYGYGYARPWQWWGGGYPDRDFDDYDGHWFNHDYYNGYRGGFRERGGYGGHEGGYGGFHSGGGEFHGGGGGGFYGGGGGFRGGASAGGHVGGGGASGHAGGGSVDGRDGGRR